MEMLKIAQNAKCNIFIKKHKSIAHIFLCKRSWYEVISGNLTPSVKAIYSRCFPIKMKSEYCYMEVSGNCVLGYYKYEHNFLHMFFSENLYHGDHVGVERKQWHPGKVTNRKCFCRLPSGKHYSGTASTPSHPGTSHHQNTTTLF
jgi:hypothetical protein